MAIADNSPLPPTLYSPRWFFLLEAIENSYRAKSCEPIAKIGSLFLSPNYPYWDIGNCLYVDLEHPDATHASLAEMEAAAKHAQTQLNAVYDNPRTPFYMTIDTNPSSQSHRLYRHWKLVLEALGYEATSGEDPDEDASHCMTFHRSQLPVLEELAGKSSEHVVSLATPQDLNATIENEPGSKDALSWRTEKCEELLARPTSVSRTYLSWESTDVAAARFILVRGQDDPRVAFIPRVNTRAEFRRKGYAKSVLVHGLLDAFKQWPDLEEVALFQGELGPERLYESIGMIKRATRMDVEFKRRASKDG